MGIWASPTATKGQAIFPYEPEKIKKGIQFKYVM